MAKVYPRMYEAIFARHLAGRRQMLFVPGPRQVGKTTTCRRLGDAYLSIDNQDDRRVIMAGPASLAARVGQLGAGRKRPVVVLDEPHKWKKWKTFLKGFFDTYEARVRVIVTGSSRLDVYRRGGDSMMGRYFPYRMHPFSVGEIARQEVPRVPVRSPVRVPEAEFRALWEHGGYPEPFVTRQAAFTRQWHHVRRTQLLREDLRDFTNVQELSQIGAVASLLEARSAASLVYSNIAESVNSSVDTIRRWVQTLVALHHGFLLRPWHRRIARSLLKEPRWYLRDWSGIRDPGARAETFVACHLLKAVEGWTDLGLGEFGLHYLRDKQHHEVDFVVVRDGSPWFLVEAKRGDDNLNPALPYFQKMTGARHAFQVAVAAPYAEVDGFSGEGPVKLSARTFLSQLL
ncbi:MAG: AAA family ATPase [Candidatus Coatesbacteria bacterium]